ncbi:hypothetical protein [Papillibacter cinnamivorans]|uniref:Uncharacterized protein n=1 Tax=Papillibacter cinnamivorans DSM 12816 TaxID=1122930 RepID=A0A1W1ZG01_9FIRM|nr:hypothetical protein [Papillibacter cinnamivorans]SMC47293.1 hypothetical protein SAMN02745168_1047 [Papillibacter cinnamivorans DSM 12816]
MQPVFTLQYAEYKVANKLNELFHECSVFVPASSQEKGIDLLLYNRNDHVNQVITIQVKSSRVYFGKKTNTFQNYLWLNRFDIQQNADWYLIAGVYPRFPSGKAVSEVNCNSINWETLILAFTNREMTELLASIRQKRNPAKPDIMFGFGFNTPDHIYLTRGHPEPDDMTQFLLERRINDMLKMLFK